MRAFLFLITAFVAAVHAGDDHDGHHERPLVCGVGAIEAGFDINHVLITNCVCEKGTEPVALYNVEGVRVGNVCAPIRNKGRHDEW